MKTSLSAAAAMSLSIVCAAGADLALPVKAPPAAPIFTWSGCYVGGQGGGGWGQKDLTAGVGLLSATTGFTAANLDVTGYMLGGQVGCNYQFAAGWIGGIEGAAAGGRIGGGNGVAQPSTVVGDSVSFNETTDLVTSATARLGVTWERWLLYVKGGGAWVGDRYNVDGTFGGVPFALQGVETRFGWTAGGGLEWAIWNNWSVKLEYDYYGLGTRNVTFIDATTGVSGPENIRQSIQLVTLGLNFHIWGGSSQVP
jgi:opacity protein-like surface antigen